MLINNNANELGSGTTAEEERLATRKPPLSLSSAGLSPYRFDDDKTKEPLPQTPPRFPRRDDVLSFTKSVSVSCHS